MHFFSLFLSILQIDWYDPWLIALMLVHIGTTTAAFCTRNHSSFQVVLFLVLCKPVVLTILSSTFVYISLLVRSAISLLFGNNQRNRIPELEIIFTPAVFRQQWIVYIDCIFNTNSIKLHVHDCKYPAIQRYSQNNRANLFVLGKLAV